MLLPSWDVGRLIGLNQNLTIPISDLGRTFHHNPVLTTVSMHLQAKTSACFNVNAFYFEAWSLLQNGVRPPRPIDRSRLFKYIMSTLLESRNGFLDVLRFIRMGHQ